MRYSLLLIIVLSSGCATLPPGQPELDSDSPEIASLQRLLHDASVDVQASLRMLAEVNNAAAQSSLTAEQKRQAIIAATQTPPGMAREIALSWVGPAETVLATLARHANSVFETVGRTPMPPLPVVRIEGRMPVINAVRDIGFQLQDRARVSVYSQRKIVLEYRR